MDRTKGERERIFDDNGQEITIKKVNADRMKNPFFVEPSARDKPIAASPKQRGGKRGHSTQRSDASMPIYARGDKDLPKLPGQDAAFHNKPLLRNHYQGIIPTQSRGGEELEDSNTPTAMIAKLRR